MSIKPRASIMTTAFDEHGGPDGSQLDRIDFSVNSNPFGPPEALLEHLKTIDVSTYPDPTASKARALAAKHHQVESENIVFGNGTAELIHRIAASFINQGDKVAVVTPTFGEYSRACKLYGAEVIEIDAYTQWGNKGLQLLIENIRAAKLVWLCHPNNPTGHIWSFDDLQTLADACEAQDALLIIDAAYLDLTLIEDKRLPENCLRLHSLTKAFTVAGVRAGYTVAPKETILALERAAAPWQASSHAQAVAEWSFSQEAKSFLDKTVPELLELRISFRNAIKALGFEVLETETNFFLVDVGDASMFKQEAEKAGFLVRNCSSFGLPNCVRLATQLPEVNQLFLNWLTNITGLRRVVGTQGLASLQGDTYA